MSESMSISVNGHCRVPPGFRFHPTEEELLLYYLRKKVSSEKIDLDVIRDVDLNKLEPWEIQENCKIGSTPQNDWYLFSHKDKKYPTGTRTNRATAAGFWKATGRDKQIYSNGKRIGMRKTLVFYKGRAPHGQKSEWIMHEYRLDDTTSTSNTNFVSNDVVGDAVHEEGWVVCRTFKKKNYLKGVESPLASSSIIAGETGRTHLYDSCDEGALEQILHQTGRGSKEENHEEASDYNNGTRSANNNNNNNKSWYHDDPIIPEKILAIGNEEGSVTNWATMDRMVALQLNGESDEGSRQLACFNHDFINMGYCTGAGQHDLQLPTLQSSSTPTHSRVAAYEYGTDPITQNFASEIDLCNFAPTPTTSSFLSSSEPTPVEYSSIIQ